MQDFRRNFGQARNQWRRPSRYPKLTPGIAAFEQLFVRQAVPPATSVPGDKLAKLSAAPTCRTARTPPLDHRFERNASYPAAAAAASCCRWLRCPKRSLLPLLLPLVDRPTIFYPPFSSLRPKVWWFVRVRRRWWLSVRSWNRGQNSVIWNRYVLRRLLAEERLRTEHAMSLPDRSLVNSIIAPAQLS